jgi:nicotinate-nucleotide adenylyltransferase
MVRVRRRIAFFGGTFDPVHLGHLAMAGAAADALSLHRVYFVPAGQNPFKKAGTEAPASDRLEMLRLATGSDPRLSIWEGELGRKGPSYTLHSVEHIERVYPNSHLFWIIGSDQLAKLDQWHGIERLVNKIGFILVQRPGHSFTWPPVPGLRVYPVRNLPVDVSATEIRRQARLGRPLSGWVPPDVETYICRAGLYRPGSGTGSS